MASTNLTPVQQQAAWNLADMLAVVDSNEGPWIHFTCFEITRFKEFLNAFDYTFVSDAIELAHASHDDDPSDAHHALYLTLKGEG